MHVGAMDACDVIRLKLYSLSLQVSCALALRDIIGFGGKIKTHST